MNVEVRQARYFIAVAEELHFGRAARRLRMSQPPLSQAILQLERDLGVRLLHRTSRHVTLTKAGEVLLRHSRQLVRDAEQARAALLRARDGFSGQLVIGAVASAFTDVLPAALRRYRTARPDVRLRLLEVDTETGARAVENRDIDIALVRRATGGPGYRAVPLRHDHFVAALPLDHPHATGPATGAGPPDHGTPNPGTPDLGPPDLGPPDHGPPNHGPPNHGPPDLGPPDLGPPDPGPPNHGPLDPGPLDHEPLDHEPLDHEPLDHGTPNHGTLDLAELAAEPWVWIPRDISPGYHDEVVAACRRAGFSPDARHQANSINTQLAMVSCGIGVAIVPSLAARSRRDLAVRPLRDPAPLIALSLLVHQDIDPLVEHFVTTVSRTLSPIAAR